MTKPTVYLVGSGPGSVDLLTVAAYRIITAADVLIVDALVGDEIIALASNAEIICVGKRAGRLSPTQSTINSLLIEQASAAKVSGKTVVRLKGGDPLIFARAQEEIDALNDASITFAIIPGISAIQAAHAHIKQPMTRRGVQRALVIATPQVQAGDTMGIAWARPLVAAGGGAIYMAASAASRIKGTLLALGLAASTPVTWVANAGRSDCTVYSQQLDTLSAPLLAKNAAVILLVGIESQSWNSSAICGASQALALPAPSLV